HQAMLFVRHAIDAAFGYEFSGPVLALHNSFPEGDLLPKREPVILRSSNRADKGRSPPGSAIEGEESREGLTFLVFRKRAKRRNSRPARLDGRPAPCKGNEGGCQTRRLRYNPAKSRKPHPHRDPNGQDSLRGFN